jgi:hypothetical protein
MSQRWGAGPDDWAHFDLVLGLGPDLLPTVCNPAAEKSERSALEQPGKVPSRYYAGRKFGGIAKWTEYEASAGDLEQWAREPDYGICVQTRHLRALDFDITDPEIAERARAVVEEYVGASARRIRSNSPKFLLPVWVEGELAKRTLRLGDAGIIEFLATGQQFVAVGTHTSGVRYEWSPTPHDFPTLTLEMLDHLWRRLSEVFEAKGATGSVTNRAERRSAAAERDAVGRHLIEHDWVRRARPDGALDIRCPWEDEHSTDTVSATTYFPANTNGYALGHFECLHAHCCERTDAEFKLAVGYDDTGFEVLPPEDDPPEETVESDDSPLGQLTFDELFGEPYEPPVVVDGYILQDAGGFVAPGGAGKTTLLIYEAIHIALGLPLYGREVVRPGCTLLVTAEDSREIIASRANKICRALGLTEAEVRLVAESIFVVDLTDDARRLVRTTKEGAVARTKLADDIVSRYGGFNVAQVVFDPVSLIGPGETSGNDGLAELMRTGRYIGRALHAAVRFVHHVAQVVARNGITDQYAGRGGTAFADNSRFQHQLVQVVARTFKYEGGEYGVPTDVTDEQIARGRVLAIYTHKLSYQERERTPILLLRDGFSFRVLATIRVEAGSPLSDLMRVVRYVEEQYDEGEFWSANQLKSDPEHRDAIGLSRDRMRVAVDAAMKDLLTERPYDAKHPRKATKRTHYLVPTRPDLSLLE